MLKEIMIIGEKTDGDACRMSIGKDGIVHIEMWWDSKCVGDERTLGVRETAEMIELLAHSLKMRA